MSTPRTAQFGTARLWHWVVFVVSSVITIGAGLLALAVGGVPLAVMAVLFGIGAGMSLVSAFDRRPRILLSPRGLWVRGLSVDALPWEHIIDCEEGEMPRARGPGRRFLALEIRDAKRLEEAVGPLHLERDGTRLVLGTEDIDVVDGELPKLVRAWIHSPIGARPAKPKARDVPPPPPPMPKIDEGPYRSAAEGDEEGTPFFPTAANDRKD